MPTSGSTDFSVTRDDIIQEAYEQLGVLNEGETPTADQITSASRTLNMLMKTWQADQMNLFAVDRYVVFINKGQQSYSLTDTTTDNFTKFSQIKQQSIAVASLAGTNTITVADASLITPGDFISISTGTDVQWTTVTLVVLNTITLNDNLTSDAQVGDIVWTYTSKAKRPMKVMEGYVHITRSNTDIPLGNLSRRKYDSLTRKDNQGLVNQFYYDPQRTLGNLYLWPTGSDETNYVQLVVQRTLDDLDDADDEPDFPQEWFLPLALNLAVLIAPKVGVETDVYQELAMQARHWYDVCKDWDEELYTSIFLRPDMRGEDD